MPPRSPPGPLLRRNLRRPADARPRSPLPIMSLRQRRRPQTPTMVRPRRHRHAARRPGSSRPKTAQPRKRQGRPRPPIRLSPAGALRRNRRWMTRPLMLRRRPARAGKPGRRLRCSSRLQTSRRCPPAPAPGAPTTAMTPSSRARRVRRRAGAPAADRVRIRAKATTIPIRSSGFANRASSRSRSQNRSGSRDRPVLRPRSSAVVTAGTPVGVAPSSPRPSSSRVVRASIASWSCARRAERIQIGVLEDGVLVEHYVAKAQRRASSATSTSAGCRTCCRAWRPPSSISDAAETPCSTQAKSTGRPQPRGRQATSRDASNSRSSPATGFSCR